MAAVVAAVGPAVHERSVYQWPPQVLPAETPARAWYTPLLLSNRVPASIEVLLPCDLPPALSAAGASRTVLATARDPVSAEGLRIALLQDSLLFSVGERRLASVPWPPRETGCPLAVRVANGELILPSRRIPIGSSYPGGMPSVSSLFSELDLRATDNLHVTVETRTYATSPTARQIAASAAVFALIAAVFLLFMAAPLLAARRTAVSLARRAWHEIGAVDVVVVGLLLAWWVLSPAFGDDGWIWAREHAFVDVGAFSNYFDTYGANQPFAYWLEWLQHWLVTATDELALQRTLSLAVLLVCWPLSRWCLRRAVGSKEEAPVLWVLGAAFALLTMSLGMTLRPEPFVCLLIVVNLAVALSFSRTSRMVPLTIAMIVTPLAMTAHPAGIVALAPIIAVSGALISSLRQQLIPRAGAGAVAVGAVALTLVLMFLDRDMGAWNADRWLLEQSEHYRQVWWWEPARYTGLLKANSWGTSMRQMSVAILLLAVIAYVSRRRSEDDSAALRVPARSLAIALALFILTPSKPVWHFGTLAAVGAVAIASECARFLSEAERGGKSALRPLIAVELVIAAFIWSWMVPFSWNALDLQTTTWEDAFSTVELGGSRFLTWFLLLAAAVVVTAIVDRRRRRRGQPTPVDLPWRITAWALPLSICILISATLAVLLIDTARATGWTATRQQAGALVGRTGCGIADQIRVSRDPSPRATGQLESLSVRMKSAGTLTLPDHLFAPFFPCARLPSIAHGVAVRPDLIVTRRTLIRPIGKPESSFAGVADLYTVRLLHEATTFRIFTVDDTVVGATIARATRVGSATSSGAPR